MQRAAGRRAGARLAWLAPALGVALASAGRADVVLDGSMGSAGPVPFDGTTWQITDNLGRRSGGNLYHSFSLFGVGAGQTASFHLLDPTTPEPSRVIARVTGGQASLVDGRIQSLHEGADLYLINPSGFSFGPTSAVQALGSVTVSTADVVRFGSGPPLDARSHDAPPVLSADAPTAFGFLSGAPAAIDFDLDRSVSGFDFPVPPGETFAAVGGDVRVRGWSASPGSVPTIRIEGGNVEIASVHAAGIDVPVDVASFDARGRAPGELGQVELSRNALVDVGAPFGSGVGSGRVVIRGGRLVVDDARIDAVAGSAVDGAPVAADLEVAEDAVVRAGSRLTTSSATAAGGDLRIAGRSVLVTGAGTRLTATASGTGAAPDVSLTADSLHVGDQALVFVRTTQPAGETGGRIALGGKAALVDGAANVLNRTQGAGAGGSIDVNVDGDLVVASRGQIFSQAVATATGVGGDVSVHAGGSIQVIGEDSAEAVVSQISALTSSSSPTAHGGHLRVSAPRIELRDGGQLRTTTSGAAAGGTLEVADTELLRVSGNATVAGQTAAAGLFARTTGDDLPGAGAGPGGGIAIAATEVEVLDGGEISTRTLRDGAAGDLVIRADRLSVRGGPRGFSTLSSEGNAGAGGSIDLGAGQVELASGGIVTASTVGDGDAGNLHVAADRIEISDAPSGLFSQTTFGASTSGAAGDIRVDVGQRLVVRDGGRISVDANRGRGAGDVQIHGGPHALVAVVGGDVSARSRGNAEAGNVVIDAGRRFVAGRGATVATRAEGNVSGGQIAISASGISYLSGSSIETLVDSGGSTSNGNGGDVNDPRAGGPVPRLGVLLRPSIIATANDGNGGNITVAATDLIASQGGVIDATSQGGGISGTVQVTGPDADLAGQLAPLPSNFLDASKLMTTACDARRARTGSFVVQTREAIEPPPDAPLRASEAGGEAEPDAGCGARDE